LPGRADEVLAAFAKAGIGAGIVAVQLLGEGIESHGKSRIDLRAGIASQIETVKAA